MRRYLYITTVIIGLLAIPSCKDWLDVSPMTEMTKKKLFTSQEGFRDALTGVYIKMKGTQLYGQTLTWDNIERLAQHWDSSYANLAEDPWVTYNYISENMENSMLAIYRNLYSVIADVNNILSEIDNKKDLFEEGWYELIKGEALAIRAFIHLDILRMWGPVPGSASTGTILPYVKTVTLDSHPHHTLAEYSRLLEEDLDLAEKLLEVVDPIIRYSVFDVNNPDSGYSAFRPENNYWAYRQIRMNYYGVLATKARFYQWTGNNTEANKYATKVIEAKNTEHGELQFTLATSADIAAYDYSFSREHIFAVEYYDLYKLANDNFSAAKGNLKKDAEFINNVIFSPDVPDIRKNLWANYSTGTSGDKKHTIIKYVQPPTEASRFNKIPLIRLAEMYYIAMATGTLDEAKVLYDEFRTARGITTPKTINDRTDLEELLTEEYNKEFYAEGQMFYAYKLFNRKNILSTSSLTPEGSQAVYVVPLPPGELTK